MRSVLNKVNVRNTWRGMSSSVLVQQSVCQSVWIFSTAAAAAAACVQQLRLTSSRPFSYRCETLPFVDCNAARTADSAYTGSPVTSLLAVPQFQVSSVTIPVHVCIYWATLHSKIRPVATDVRWCMGLSVNCELY